METRQANALGARNWLVMAALALTGQIAWAVENSWFNTFVYDTITRSPQAVAWMVAASAITATLTTLLMGALSDRIRGRWGRRPFILIGYALWGIATILFPTVSYIQSATLAVILVVLADSIMTFFGSTANDAAFNAWTVDIAPGSVRGKVEGVLNLSLFLAQLISLAAAGVFIESYGYFVFFYSLGGIVLLVGLIAGWLLQDAPLRGASPPARPYWTEIFELARPGLIRRHAGLFMILTYIMIISMGFQIAFPYLIIYLEHFIGYS